MWIERQDKEEFKDSKISGLRVTFDSRITKKEHIAQIRDKRNKIRSGICPRCGAKLLLRNGKDGCFFECSNYPDCRFTKNLD